MNNWKWHVGTFMRGVAVVAASTVFVLISFKFLEYLMAAMVIFAVVFFTYVTGLMVRDSL